MDVFCEVPVSSRVRRICEAFDLSLGAACRVSLRGDDVVLPEGWTCGALVGASGSGKSTLARRLFADASWLDTTVMDGACVVDQFGADVEINEVGGFLCAAGLHSIPAWVRPVGVLSRGERYRCGVALGLWRLACRGGWSVVVVDDFADAVDEATGRSLLAGVVRWCRECRRRLVVVSPRETVLEWGCFDWVVRLPSGSLEVGPVQYFRRLVVDLGRVHRAEWERFRAHHYLSGDLVPSAACFGAVVNGLLAGFCAVLPFPHPSAPGFREHRLVVLPEFQGLGIGRLLADTVAGGYCARGDVYRSVIRNPFLVMSRRRSSSWVERGWRGNAVGVSAWSSFGLGAPAGRRFSFTYRGAPSMGFASLCVPARTGRSSSYRSMCARVEVGPGKKVGAVVMRGIAPRLRKSGEVS